MVRQRLMTLTKKSNTLLLLVGILSALNFIGWITVFFVIKGRFNRKILSWNRFVKIYSCVQFQIGYDRIHEKQYTERRMKRFTQATIPLLLTAIAPVCANAQGDSSDNRQNAEMQKKYMDEMNKITQQQTLL